MLLFIIGMACSSYMASYMLTIFGTKRSKADYGVSDQMDEIVRAVVETMHKNATLLDSTGVYTNQEHKILPVLLQSHQYHKVLRIINTSESSAFVFVRGAYFVWITA